MPNMCVRTCASYHFCTHARTLKGMTGRRFDSFDQTKLNLRRPKLCVFCGRLLMHTKTPLEVSTMTKDSGTQRPFPPSSSFSTSTLTLCITIVRLVLIFGLIPEEIALVVGLPSVQSTIVPSRETLRYLQVSSSFRHLFPSTSQAYIASSSPPPVLVWISYLALEKWWAPIPQYWRGVLWRLTLLLVDYMIATLLERIATSSLQSENETKEEELLVKMPAAIQPQRAHLFEIASSTNAKQSNDTQDTPPMIVTADIPTLSANLYYASFITILSSGVYDSFQNVYCLLVLWSVYEMMFRSDKTQRVSLAAVALALATYVHPWSMVFAVPICVSQRSVRMASVFAVLFVVCLLWLQLLAFLLLGPEAYWTWKPVEALTPNLGPLWYFQMQLFNRFHDYFALMITGMPYLVVIPLTIRLHRYPIVLVSLTIRSARSACCSVYVPHNKHHSSL
jgi:hypothetical protein